MKKNVLFIMAFIIILLSLSACNKEKDRIIMTNMEEIDFSKVGKKDNFLLFYPADIRTSQDYTLVKEVSKTGEIIQEYEIRDKAFRRMAIHQKPNNINELYISFFGEAVIQNWYYTYDIADRKFKKVDLDYFKYDVGVDHIMHYGPDVLFQNLVSHKTGDQNYDNNTGNFNMSISNFTTKKSYETEYGYAPNWSPILKLDETIIYSGSGQVNEDGIPENAFVALINSNNEKIEYTNLDKQATSFYPIYATEEKAYIVGAEGKLFVLDKNLNYETYEPFKHLSKKDFYYRDNITGILLLDKHTALYNLYDEKDGVTLGLLTFKNTPSFSVLNKDYINKEMDYEMLYQDIQKKEIYLMETDYDGNAHLLVLDNQNLNLKYKIPVKQDHLLDFVLKI
ncbi:hypothetical protein [Metabacillus fastidiosus]|uniref:hypothetical protein n=1 Tax=Metabacillus fastidiosus TaxID=1458 RepID=UPI002E225117|nr:hypothetical protein [Metabacillus fastidiosus]